jgi:hypothetical protein
MPRWKGAWRLSGLQPAAVQCEESDFLGQSPSGDTRTLIPVSGNQGGWGDVGAGVSWCRS